MSLEFDNSRYRSYALISPEEILESTADIMIEAPPVWTSLHDLARAGWEMKVVSSGGVFHPPVLQPREMESDSSYLARTASWSSGRTHIHLRRREQQNYGIKLTIRGRFYNIDQLRQALVERTYTSTLGLTLKCLDATDDAAEQVIDKYGWSNLMNARLRMVDREIGPVADKLRSRQPDPNLPSRLARVAGMLEAEAAGKVVQLRGAA